MSVTEDLEIQGNLQITLHDYEKMIKNILSLRKENEKYMKRAAILQKASKELAAFLNHMARKVDNFDNFVGAFNSSAEGCEIMKTDDNKYIINLNVDYEGKEDKG